MEKFVDHCKWIKEACDNINNANAYWAVRREEKLSLRNKNEFKIGDLVKVRNFGRSKLEPYFVGPFKIIKIAFNTATLADPTTGEQFKRNVHFKNISKYHSSVE